MEQLVEMEPVVDMVVHVQHIHGLMKYVQHLNNVQLLKDVQDQESVTVMEIVEW